MATKKRIPDLEIEGGIIIFKNFSGQARKFTPEGKRSFSVIIPEEDVGSLLAQGWNIKPLKPLEEGDPIQHHLSVKVSYAIRTPEIHMVTESGHQLLEEDTVNLLDYSDIINADLLIHASPWAMGGDEGFTAYLKKAYFTIQEDSFVKKYGF